MGFRFHRSLKILPGLKLNFSGGGVSLSAGVRGARVNFGPRGSFATLGLPGTGFSYRQRIGDSGGMRGIVNSMAYLSQIGSRKNDAMASQILLEGVQNVSVSADTAREYLDDPRFTIRDANTGERLTHKEIDKRVRANELQEKIDTLQLQIAADTEDYRKFVDFWFPLPEVASLDDWKRALSPSPLQFEPPPTAPDWTTEQANLLRELTEKNERTLIGRTLPEVVSRKKAEHDFPGSWSRRENELREKYNANLEDYSRRFAEAKAHWSISDTSRIAWIGKLLEGDHAETERTINEILSGLKFPFETKCDYFFDDVEIIHLHLDLPEIEDVIPEKEKIVSTDARIAEAQRPVSDRNADYARLVMGQCLYLASQMFSYLPLLQKITLAAYTQRPRFQESDEIDTYVLDVCFSRIDVVSFRKKNPNLESFYTRIGARFKRDKAGAFIGISRPSWLPT